MNLDDEKALEDVRDTYKYFVATDNHEVAPMLTLAYYFAKAVDQLELIENHLEDIKEVDD